jgi:hypothetical protein
MDDTTNAGHTASIEEVKYINAENAPIICFDQPVAHRTAGGLISVEVAMRTLVPTPEGGLVVEVSCTGRLRGGPAAIASLRDACTAALRLYAQMCAEAQTESTESPEAAGRLN